MKNFMAVILLLVASTLHAQDATTKAMYYAYIGNNANTTDEWKKAVQNRKQELSKNATDPKLNYALLLAQWGLLNATMKTKDEDLFDDYYDPALETIEEITGSDKKWAEPYAIQSAIYGLKMGYSPIQGMILGSKSSGLIEKAKKLNNSSPLVWKIYANSKLFTPEMWGGDLKEAIQAFEKSIALYEANPNDLPFNWFYLDTLAFQGQAYLKDGQRAKAISTYEKALKVEPEFAWVKNVLLPKAQKSN